MDDTLTAHLKLAEYYNVPVPPYPMPSQAKRWVVEGYVSALSVREGPGIEYARVKYLKGGDIVTVLQQIGDWAEIAPGEWVSKQYLRKVE